MELAKVRLRTLKYAAGATVFLVTLVLFVQNQNPTAELFNDVYTRADELGVSTRKEVKENKAIRTELLYEPGFRVASPNICSDNGQHLKLLVLITSAPSHRGQRDTIRQTWGHVSLRRDVSLAFFVGTSLGAAQNLEILEENELYGDMIQGNFMDSYNNLTLKTISMLEWTLTYCNQSQLLLKTDDDMYINFPKLFEILNNRFNNASRSIIGNVAKKWKPFRDPKSPYYLSREQYPARFLPDFNSGPAYVVTNDAISDLYNASLQGIFFKLEDVYVTGMIATQLNIKHIHVPEFYNKRPKKITPCYVYKGVSVHMVRKEEMHSLWKDLSLNTTMQCTSVKV